MPRWDFLGNWWNLDLDGNLMEIIGIHRIYLGLCLLEESLSLSLSLWGRRPCHEFPQYATQRSGAPENIVALVNLKKKMDDDFKWMMSYGNGFWKMDDFKKQLDFCHRLSELNPNLGLPSCPVWSGRLCLTIWVPAPHQTVSRTDQRHQNSKKNNVFKQLFEPSLTVSDKSRCLWGSWESILKTTIAMSAAAIWPLNNLGFVRKMRFEAWVLAISLIWHWKNESWVQNIWKLDPAAMVHHVGPPSLWMAPIRTEPKRRMKMWHWRGEYLLPWRCLKDMNIQVVETQGCCSTKVAAIVANQWSRHVGMCLYLYVAMAL